VFAQSVNDVKIVPQSMSVADIAISRMYRLVDMGSWKPGERSRRRRASARSGRVRCLLRCQRGVLGMGGKKTHQHTQKFLGIKAEMEAKR
jgi:hypothetical protein